MDGRYLVFSHHDARFGLSLEAVQEIVWLPELSPIEELPPYIIGVFNLRGRVVPVMDLGLRLGHGSVARVLTDQIIVFEGGVTRAGLIANECCDVVVIAPSDIDAVDRYRVEGGQAQFVWGEARGPFGLVMLLDVDALLGGVHDPPTREAAVPAEPSLADEDREIFRARTRRLAETASTGPGVEAEPFMVIRLEDEWVGLPLAEVKEIAHLRGLTPLPCSPPYVVGAMNLRGDILTLIDLRPALGISAASALSEVVVVGIGDARVGLAVAEIVDILRLTRGDVAKRPSASRIENRRYFEGTAAHAGKAVTVIDLAQILAANTGASTQEH